MKITPVTCALGEHTLLLRSAEKDDAELLLPYLKRVCGETPFLSRYADECGDLTIEEEEAFIASHAGERACLILAFLDGEFAGNASFTAAGPSRRDRHRAVIGISLYAAYTGMGIGTRLFGLLMETIRRCGFEMAELTVYGGNTRALRLYERFGFRECGRVPRGRKLDDGTCLDEVHMISELTAPQAGEGMRVTTDRLVLRPFRASDAADLLAYLQAPTVHCFEDMKLADLAAAQRAAAGRAADPWYLAIELKENGRVIGELFGHPEGTAPDQEDCDTFSPCWMLNPAYQGKGYAYEAVHAWLDHLFTEKGIRRVYAFTEDYNRASQKLCEKLGMRLEGEFREFVSFVKDENGEPIWENTLQYAILKREWLAQRKEDKR